MDDRKIRILQAIIDDYILTAMPVGSRTISRKEGIGLSSATIRNEMSDLEELGYLDQPHTSAGRVPSWKAYRWYVDQISRINGLPTDDVNRIRGLFSRRLRQIEEMASSVAQVISELTDYTAVVVPPKVSALTLARAQLVRISDETALLVLVTNGGTTHEAVVAIPKDWQDDHLYALSGLLTRHIRGRTFDDVEEAIRHMSLEMAGHARVFDSITRAVDDAVSGVRSKLVLGGASQLLKQPEYADIEKARTLLGALEAREGLEQVLAGRTGIELSIFIGPEMQVSGMEDCSLVTVSYRLGEGLEGAMGVIGPTRMRYGRVLSVLEGMKQAMREVFLSNVEEDPNNDEEENGI